MTQQLEYLLDLLIFVKQNYANPFSVETWALSSVERTNETLVKIDSNMQTFS